MLTDVAIAADLWSRVSPGVHTFTVIVVDGDPPPKERPRTNMKTGQVYHSPEGKAAEAATAQVLRSAMKQPMSGNIAIGATFFRRDRTNVDDDNLLKHLMDSANGILWHDDVQVTGMLAVVELDAERPRTVIALGEHISSMDRTTIREARSRTRRSSGTAGATFNQCISCGKLIARGLGDLCHLCRGTKQDTAQ